MIGRSSAIVASFAAAARIVASVPSSVADPLIDLVGDLLWLTNRSARNAVEANLLRVLGVPNRHWRRAVRLTFRNGARYYYATFRTPTLTPEGVVERMPIAGWHHVDDALRVGRGLILVTPHTSGVGMGGQVFAAHGHPVTVPVEPLDPPELLSFMIGLRRGVGVRLAPLGPRLGIELARALRRNEVVALLADRDISGNAVRVPFFGEMARLPSGPATLALRTGAVLLPCFAIALRNGRFRGVIDAPVPVHRMADSDSDVVRITRAVASRLEYHIARMPEHWTVFQPIWGPVS